MATKLTLKPKSNTTRTDGRSMKFGGKPSGPIKGARKTSGKGLGK